MKYRQMWYFIVGGTISLTVPWYHINTQVGIWRIFCKFEQQAIFNLCIIKSCEELGTELAWSSALVQNCEPLPKSNIKTLSTKLTGLRLFSSCM